MCFAFAFAFAFATIAAALASLALAFAMPATALAADTVTSGDTELTVTVPSSHGVTLDVGANGSVAVNGVSYCGEETKGGTCEIRVERLARQQYTIVAENGYRVSGATYDGKTVTLDGGVFTAPAINRDGIVLLVRFEKDPGAARWQSADNGADGGAGSDAGSLARTGVDVRAFGVTAFGVGTVAVAAIAVGGTGARVRRR